MARYNYTGSTSGYAGRGSNGSYRSFLESLRDFITFGDEGSQQSLLDENGDFQSTSSGSGLFGSSEYSGSGFLGLGSSLGQFLSALANRLTGAHMVNADIEANALSMQNQEDIFQRQVTGMQKAGLNPALMYQNGSSPSTPQAQNSYQGAANMSDLMSLITLPLQMKSLKAQIDNTNSKTRLNDTESELNKKRAENMALVNQYYPSVTEAGLEKTLSEIGVNLSTIDKNEAETALTNVKKLLADKENKYADEYYHWRAEYEKAHTQEAKDAAAAHAAQALMTGYEYEYASTHGAKLSSSSILALVSAIGEFTGLTDEGNRSAIRGIFTTAMDDVKHPGQMYKKAGEQALNLAKKGAKKLKSAYKRFERWRNREKKMPWVR